jgi:glycosyltransferase involved in cell wall biosynthesis
MELLPNRIKARISICIQGSNIPDLSSFDNSNISVVCNKYSQMEDFYEGIDCLVVPSYADNYPSVATEAAASGCHLIVSNVGGLTEIAREFGGSIFRSGDYHQLYMLLRNLLEKGFSDIGSDSSSLSYSNSGNEYYRAYQRAVDRTQ